MLYHKQVVKGNLTKGRIAAARGSFSSICQVASNAHHHQIHVFFGPCDSCSLNGISVGSAALTQFTLVTARQKDTQTHYSTTVAVGRILCCEILCFDVFLFFSRDMISI